MYAFAYILLHNHHGICTAQGHGLATLYLQGRLSNTIQNKAIGKSEYHSIKHVIFESFIQLLEQMNSVKYH